MTEINFCPFCDAPQHKITSLNEELSFCRECDKFFSLKEVKLKCLKCGSERIADSGFPSPDGDMVFQCTKCKKMFPAKEFLEKMGVK